MQATDFQPLAKGFTHAKLKELQGNAFTLGENLTYLLHRYASSVPSSTMHLPDVSLFDHLKSTAIFALCIYDYLSEKERLQAPFQIKAQESPVLLIGGDLSGIQSYIYDIVSSDAARNLKGRSFYLQILVENAVEQILNKLNLPGTAIIYTSGGSFYLLAPNTDKTITAIQEVKKELSDIIFEQHKTSLSLNIDWQEVTQAQIMQQSADDGIHKAWKELTLKIAKSKSQKFKHRLIEEYNYFFSPSDSGGKQVRDFITGEELTDEEVKKINSGKTYSVVTMDNDPKKLIKKSTNDQIEIGKKLRRTEYWITSPQPVPHWRSFEFRIGEMGVYNYLLSGTEVLNSGNRHPDNVLIRTLNIENKGFQSSVSLFKGQNCVHGFTFYGGNSSPENEKGDGITYDQMAKTGDGADKLGVLRMDVDNLGSIFISGLEAQKRTFSRYSVLSRNLDYFFKGYLNTIWEEGYEQSTSIIYSGGDDLFIVGYWKDIIGLARKIHSCFNEWTCNNPMLSISGGIALTGGKFPISKGAKFAEEAEKLAKEHTLKNAEKNAITLFGVPLNWQYEFPIVLELYTLLSARLANQKIPRGLLQKMMNYAEVATYQEKNKKSQSWRWQIAYDFSRAVNRKDTDSVAFYDTIKNAAITNIWNNEYITNNSNYSFLDLLNVAARWTELESKK